MIELLDLQERHNRLCAASEAMLEGFLQQVEAGEPHASLATKIRAELAEIRTMCKPPEPVPECEWLAIENYGSKLIAYRRGNRFNCTDGRWGNAGGIHKWAYLDSPDFYGSPHYINLLFAFPRGERCYAIREGKRPELVQRENYEFYLRKVLGWLPEIP